ncbi:MAG TPA: hypothetical protein VGA65_05620, partial [Hyphomicrobium sp.]
MKPHSTTRSKLRLAASRDEDVGTFIDEALRRRKANTIYDVGGGTPALIFWRRSLRVGAADVTAWRFARLAGVCGTPIAAKYAGERRAIPELHRLRSAATIIWQS